MGLDIKLGRVLGIVYRTLATHIIHKAGLTQSTAHTGAVTLIQRFGSALNLNVHFYMLYLDGVYAGDFWSATQARDRNNLALVSPISHSDPICRAAGSKPSDFKSMSAFVAAPNSPISR